MQYIHICSALFGTRCKWDTIVWHQVDKYSFLLSDTPQLGLLGTLLALAFWLFPFACRAAVGGDCAKEAL